MFSPSDRKHHKAGTGGLSNKGDRKSRLFDGVLLEYEKFASGEMTRRQGDKAAVAYQCEVTGSSTSGRTEVWSDRRESVEESSSWDHGESEGVVPGVKERDDSSLAASGGLEIETESSLFPSSVITRESMVIPRVIDSPTHLPQGYVDISSHHLFAGLRFSLPRILIRVLNFLELMLMQLTLNTYTWLLSLYLIFRRKRIGSLTDNILRHCFQMKKCPKNLLGPARPDGIYYLPAWSGDY
ncbi:hypothetical protein ACOSQ2_013689 [Xanthoceras sorbifolium]